MIIELPIHFNAVTLKSVIVKMISGHLKDVHTYSYIYTERMYSSYILHNLIHCVFVQGIWRVGEPLFSLHILSVIYDLLVLWDLYWAMCCNVVIYTMRSYVITYIHIHIVGYSHWFALVTWTTVPCYILFVVVVDSVMTGSTKSHQTVGLG